VSILRAAFVTLYAVAPPPPAVPPNDPAPLETFTTRPPSGRRRGERLGHSPRAEEVDLHITTDPFEVGIKRALVGVVVDTGIVDERIDVAEFVAGSIREPL
jgi:hypothetical protein